LTEMSARRKLSREPWQVGLCRQSTRSVPGGAAAALAAFRPKADIRVHGVTERRRVGRRLSALARIEPWAICFEPLLSSIMGVRGQQPTPDGSISDCPRFVSRCN
jgi:hypothetical protein